MARNLPFEAFHTFGALYLLGVKTENRLFLAAYSLSVVLPLLFVVGGPALSVPRLMLPASPVFVDYASLIRGALPLALRRSLPFTDGLGCTVPVDLLLRVGQLPIHGLGQLHPLGRSKELAELFPIKHPHVPIDHV